MQFVGIFLETTAKHFIETSLGQLHFGEATSSL